MNEQQVEDYLHAVEQWMLTVTTELEIRFSVWRPIPVPRLDTFR